MRIKIIQKPELESIDGIRLDRFQLGQQYDVGTTLASVLLAEGWAEPASDVGPALVVDFSDFKWPRTDAADRPAAPRERTRRKPEPEET